MGYQFLAKIALTLSILAAIVLGRTNKTKATMISVFIMVASVITLSILGK